MKREFNIFAITKLTPVEKILELVKKDLPDDCEKCGICCNYDSGFLTKEDIERISKHLGKSEEDFIRDYLEGVEKFNTKGYKFKRIKNGKPYGRCVFYNKQEGCLIHGIKPLHCKIGSCGKYGELIAVWHALNYFVNPADPESIRQWAIYLKTHPTIPGGELNQLVPDTEKLKKILNFEILK